MNNQNWFVIIMIVVIVAVAAYFIGQSSNNASQPNKTTTVQVEKFYNGQDGYSISIPSGNNSTCMWTWVDGSAAIPNSKTTNANSATEKHTILISDTASDWKVSCTDDFGNQYVGMFPMQTAIRNQQEIQAPTTQPLNTPSYYTPMTFSPATEAQRSSYVNGCTSAGGKLSQCNCDFDYIISNYGVVWLINENAYINVNGAASPEFRSESLASYKYCSVYSN